MTPRVSLSPAALAAPPAIATHGALGIATAGRFAEGVAQHALMSLPLQAVAKTAQTAVADLVALAGMAVCTDGCAGGTCGDTHVRTTFR